MSDDEDLMTDRRGIKRAHESPQKINSLFEGQALDVGDECSVESDYPDWNEHFKNHPSQQGTIHHNKNRKIQKTKQQNQTIMIFLSRQPSKILIIGT